MERTVFVLLPFYLCLPSSLSPPPCPPASPLPPLTPPTLSLPLPRYPPRPLVPPCWRSVRLFSPSSHLYHTLNAPYGRRTEIYPEWWRTAVWDLDSNRRLRSGRNAPFVPNRTNGDLLCLEGITMPLLR